MTRVTRVERLRGARWVALMLAFTLALALTGSPATGTASGLPSSPSGGSAAPSGVPRAQGVDIQADSDAQVEFLAEIRFQVRLQSGDPIRSVLLLYQVDDSSVQNTAVPAYQPGTNVTAVYGWRVANVLVPGAEVRYQWQVETQSGQKFTTPEKVALYNDTRFAWREAQGDQLTVYFHASDAQAGPALLEEAKQTQGRLSQEYGLTLDKPLKIFAYTRQQDYLSALAAGRPSSAAMTVGTDRIFVLAPGGTSGMTSALQGVRREVVNAVFLQKTRNPFADPPRWLAEGFGLFMSGEEISSQNYRTLGQIARANGLVPLKALNGNFPSGERERTLAYVESLSVVKFIMDTYGPEQMKALLAAFREGNTVDDAVKKGLGVSVDQLETRWKNALKSGRAERLGQRTGREAGQTGNGGWADRVFGPALSFWQGVFGAYTRPVLIGVAGFIVVAVLAIIGGSSFSLWRRNRAEE